MKKLALLIVLGLTAFALAGCGSSPTSPNSVSSSQQPTVPGTPEDRSDVVTAADLHPEFMNDGVYASDASMSDRAPGASGGLSTEAAITPITFQRKVRFTDRTFEYAFSDTDSTGRPRSAILTVHRSLTGTLSITAADTTGSFNAPVKIKKSFTETWTRRLQFVRIDKNTGGKGDGDGDDDDVRAGGAGQTAIENGHGDGHGNGHDRPHYRWQLVGVSPILVDTPNGVTHIQSLRFQASGLDTTISDPLHIITLGSIPTLPPGTVVTITATTSAPDDIVLLLARDRRFRLNSNGVNTYSGTFTVPASSGAQHFGVDVLSHATLYDDTAAYDSETWLSPSVPRKGSFLSAN